MDFMNRKEKTKRLTISLLCCGRRDTVERCLQSIIPLREKVDSEIQVIDTGCDKETRAIIEKYADEVFEFEWCNDFSKARNFQLDQANGEWLLYLDDDEFFLDIASFVPFFSTDEYKEYNIGGYYQRNYLDKEGKQYSDVMVARMAKITPATKFYGKVHEFILPATGNTYIFDARAGHFGYVFATQEDNIRHSNRNIPLLKEMMEEDPNELRWPYQLAQEYRSANYYDLLYSLCQEYIEKLGDENETEVNLYRGTFLVGRAIAEVEGMKLEDLKKHCDEAMKQDYVTTLAKARLCVYAARQYYIEGNFERVEELVDFYLDAEEKIGDDSLAQLLQGGIFVYDAFENAYVNTMCGYKISCCLKKKDFSIIPRYNKKISWNDNILSVTRGFIIDLINAIAECGNKKELVELIKKFYIKEGLTGALRNELRIALKKMNSQQIENIKKCFEKLPKEMVGAENELLVMINMYALMQRISEGADVFNFSQMEKLLKEYIVLAKKWFDIYTKDYDEILAEDYTSEYKLAVKLEELFALDSEDYKAGMNMLLDLVGIEEGMKKPLVAFSKLYANKQLLVKAEKQDPAKFAEMYKLEEAVLAQIAELEATGHHADAATTRGQLEGILMQTYGVKSLH